MKKRILLWLGLILLALGSIAAVVLCRFPSLPAYLSGEAFFLGRPTSYWKAELRRSKAIGQVPPETAAAFDGARDAVPVLLQCVHDPDPRVRGGSLALLGRTHVHSPEVFSAITQSLNDSDHQVRVAGIVSLANCGFEASPTLPVLTPLVHDPDEYVAQYAIFGLWHIDPPTAADVTGWRPIPDDEWGFTAMMPPKVEVKKSEAPGPKSQAIVHFYSASDDAGSFLLSVGQYPEGTLSTLPPMALWDRVRQVALMIVHDGQLEKEESIELEGRQGREYQFRIEKARTTFRIRSYWERDRVYTLVTDTADYMDTAAAMDYFFNSFRFPK